MKHYRNNPPVLFFGMGNGAHHNQFLLQRQKEFIMLKNSFSRFVARRSNIAVATLLVMLASQGPIWAQLKPKPLPPTGDVYAASCDLLFPTSEEKVEACIIGTCVNTHLNDDPTKFDGNVRKCTREADKWRKLHPRKGKKGQKKASAKKVAAE